MDKNSSGVAMGPLCRPERDCDTQTRKVGTAVSEEDFCHLEDAG